MPQRPVLIDTDPGTDDALALWMAFASPELDVRLVTVAGGNVGLDRTLANARAIVGMTGRDVPVVAGADRPLLGAFRSETDVHGEDGLKGIALPEGPPARAGVAADAIRAAIRATPGITLVGIGPATNLALALMTEPALVANVRRIVLMSGAWAEGNITASAEFNAWSDPEALAVLLACGSPATLVTLELTAQAHVTPARLATMAGGGRCHRAAHAILSAMRPSRRLPGGFPLHDPCAIAWLIAPHLFTGRDVHAHVDCGPGPARGRTVIDRWDRSGQRANVHLPETLDADGFFDLLSERLRALP